MAGYVKLFGSILQSTIWEEPPTTRCVWITMLAMSDMDGIVSASVPGLARMAGVSRAECETALASLLAPDPDSRTKEHDGRRIEAVDGGWILLNHAKYRAMQTRDERREKDAERKRRARASDDNEGADDSGQPRTEADSPQNSAPSRSVTPSEADADQGLSLSSQSGSHGNPDQTRSRVYASAPRVFLGAKTMPFLRVFRAYPRRDKEQEAAQVFQELALGYPGGEEALATAIEAAFARGMLKRHPYSGPNATRPCFDRFLAGRRWEDPESEPDTPALNRPAPSQPLPKLVGVPRPKFVPPQEPSGEKAHGTVAR